MNVELEKPDKPKIIVPEFEKKASIIKENKGMP